MIWLFKDCYPTCGVPGSIETRRRTCLGKRCQGNDIEKRPCLSCNVAFNGNWSCWTDWSECSSCTSSSRSHSIQSRTRLCLINSCQGESREERICSSCSLRSKSLSWIDSFNENRYTLIHLIFASLISFVLGCLLMLCLFGIHRQRHRHYRNRHPSNTFLHTDDRDYFQASTSNSSSSPHTAQDSDTFTTLSNPNNTHPNKFRSFDSSSSSTNGGVNGFLKEIPSRKFNMYINPREIPPLPPAATLKRTSIMSSMKTNLDADDL